MNYKSRKDLYAMARPLDVLTWLIWYWRSDNGVIEGDG